MGKKNKDKVLMKKSIIQLCSTCRKGKDKDLYGKSVQPGFVYCVQWLAPKPNNATCNEWSM